MPRAASPFPIASSLAPSPPNLFVGTSGWAYPSWKPGFYPKDVPARSFLPFYASQLTSVEVNYTFRTLPSPEQMEGWLAAVPPGFQFSFKAPQRITHFARLRECTGEVEALLLCLAPALAANKLGPLLFQLPPNFRADTDRLARFLDLPAWHAVEAPRLAFEFRHPSWFAAPVLGLLRNANAALCVAEAETPGTPDVQTATHRYYRLRCAGGYPAGVIAEQAEKFAGLAQTGEVFVYYKHEDEPSGALNARALLESLARLESSASRENSANRERVAG